MNNQITHQTLANVSSQIMQYIHQYNQKRATTEMLKQLHSPLTQQLYGKRDFNRSYGLWVSLLSAIRHGLLTWELISERPSDLSQGIAWLSHERVTALLAEQNLAYGNLPPVLFHLIMDSTNQLYPNAVINHQLVQSAHCTGQVKRMAWAITLSELPAHNQPQHSK